MHETEGPPNLKGFHAVSGSPENPVVLQCFYVEDATGSFKKLGFIEDQYSLLTFYRSTARNQ